jgi:hypothetical protein
MPGALGRFSRLREFVLEFVLAAEQVLGRNAYTVELQLGGVRCAATELVELADEFEALGAAGHDEKGLSSVAELLVDDGVDDVHAGDAAVADPHLVTVDDPVVAVTTCMRSQVANVAAALGFGDRERGKLQIPRRTETFGRPLQHLLGRSGLADRGKRQRGHHDRQADAGAAPEQLLHEHRQRHSRRIADQIAVEQRAVESAFGRLLEHRPRKLLALVVLERNRADAILREFVSASGEVVLRGGGGDVESHRVSSTPPGRPRSAERYSTPMATSVDLTNTVAGMPGCNPRSPAASLVIDDVMI